MVVIDNQNDSTDSDEPIFEGEVVDGQQRLTTMYLLLKYCYLEDEEEPNLYSIYYKTRENSQVFLQEIEKKTEEEAQENIDYFHLYLLRVITPPQLKKILRLLHCRIVHHHFINRAVRRDY